MKKLVLVVAITSLLAIGALAASYTLTPSLSVSGSYSFGFVIGNQGIDLTHGFGSKLSVKAAWSSNFAGAFTTAATWTLNLGLNLDWNGTPSVSLNSLVYESAMSKLKFEKAYERSFCGLMWDKGKAAGFTYTNNKIDGLTLQYLDTTNDGASTSPSTPIFATPFFKDEIAANYAGSNYSVTAALYYDAMNNALYDYFAGLKYTGIPDLTVLAAYGSDLARTAAPAASETGTWLPVSTAADPVPQTGLDVSYAKDFGLTKAGTVSVSAEYKYFNAFTPKYEAFVDSDGDRKADSPKFPTNANDLSGKLSYNTTLGIFTLNPWVNGDYDILNATQTAGFGVKASAKLSAGPLSITPSVDYEGSILPSFAVTKKTLDVALASTFGKVSFAGDVNWADFTNFANPTYAGYYAKATYAAHIWTYTAFFGTLSQDSNGAYTIVNPPYWYVEASTSVSF